MPGVAGTWKDLTDNVNSMASNLTAQVRNIAEVTTAVARGDLSRKITVDVKGEILELKQTVNTMVDQLNGFAAEVTRVAREVGTEGKLGGQAHVPGVAGTWKDLTDNVNSMAGNLTAQVRNIAEVTTAVARGDLSRKITADVRGEILQLKETINTMVDQLNGFAAEVTRVAREVGTEGKLGGQAIVPGIAGTWKDLTDNVNSMAGNLTARCAISRRWQPPSRAVTCRARSRWTSRARSSRSSTPSIRWWISSTASRLRSRASRARWAPRGSSAARPSSRALPALGGPYRQRQRHGREPHEPGPRHREVVTAVANGELRRGSPWNRKARLPRWRTRSTA